MRLSPPRFASRPARTDVDLNIYRVHYNGTREVIKNVRVYGELSWQWAAAEQGKVSPCLSSAAGFFSAGRIVRTQLTRKFVLPRIGMKDMNSQVSHRAYQVFQDLAPTAAELQFEPVPAKGEIFRKAMIVLLGAYSTGKSSFINALLQSNDRAEGTAPQDDKVGCGASRLGGCHGHWRAQETAF